MINRLKIKLKILFLVSVIPLFLGAYFAVTVKEKVKNNSSKTISNHPTDSDAFVVGPVCSEIVDELEYMYAGCNGFY